MECKRWRNGCGHCPDLKRPPTIRRDATAGNWGNKRRIYSKSRLAVATPSHWLMDYVKQSMINPVDSKVIPNGVDLKLFRPVVEKKRLRAKLGLPDDAFVGVSVTMGGADHNPYKDFKTVRECVGKLEGQIESQKWTLICIGGGAIVRQEPHIRYTGYLSDPGLVAEYYQCADVLLHAAHAENAPLVILEAMACGLPVIATITGGIPELISDGETGFLVPRGDSDAMAARVLYLMKNPSKCLLLGQGANVRVKENYDLNTQAKIYIDWFEQLKAHDV